ncbi:MAG: ABC transporter substrate-binding protein [candidate division WOR-3 bacterium]|nr:MAG: ABC transporter substrate-binding protein [candidate division WOR-3 bacterium]
MSRMRFGLTLFLLLAFCCKREQKVAVDFWHVMGGPLGRRLNEMIADFNRLHPEGEVRGVHMGSYDVLAQKLMGAIASNSPPVIAQMYESWTDQFYEAGQLVPLAEFVEAEEDFDLPDFFPVFIEDNTYDTTLVTLPFNKSVPVFYYNADLFEEYGIDSFPADWVDFRRVCLLIREGGIWPTSWPLDVWYFSTMLYQRGGLLFDEESGQPGFNSTEGNDVIEYLVALVRDSLFYVNPGFQRQDEFLSGNVAMIPASIVSWAFMKGKVPFEIGVAPFPQGAFRSIVIAGTNIGMFKKANKAEQELAWKFIKWFLEPQNQMRWTEASYYLPTRRSTTRTEDYREFIFENPAYEKIIRQLDFARTEPKSKEWFAGRIYLNDAIEEAMRLERSPEEALDDAAERLRLELK